LISFQNSDFAISQTKIKFNYYDFMFSDIPPTPPAENVFANTLSDSQILAALLLISGNRSGCEVINGETQCIASADTLTPGQIITLLQQQSPAPEPIQCDPITCPSDPIPTPMPMPPMPMPQGFLTLEPLELRKLTQLPGDSGYIV
jgi:hypothetical protein